MTDLLCPLCNARGKHEYHANWHGVFCTNVNCFMNERACPYDQWQAAWNRTSPPAGNEATVKECDCDVFAYSDGTEYKRHRCRHPTNSIGNEGLVKELKSKKIDLEYPAENAIVCANVNGFNHAIDIAIAAARRHPTPAVDIEGLIGKLEAGKVSDGLTKKLDGWNEAIDMGITIIRQHFGRG